MQLSVGILTAPHIRYEQRACTFLLRDVRIGIGFHWDRLEDQEFEGTLEIIHNADGTETAVNHIDLEDYLTSVISSEMSADSPMELLKAHAIIARSWVVRLLQRREAFLRTGEGDSQEFHRDFDICADDHCQRYEGIRRRNARAIAAVRATSGQVLTYPTTSNAKGFKPLQTPQASNGSPAASICDCRYHKCCGGRTEEFRTCWEDTDVPYLRSVADTRPDGTHYCNTRDARVLALVLNNYDQETHDFFEWEVSYTAEELGRIYRDKSGHDLGAIVALEPLHRGPSGRIDRLRVTGTKGEETIGKELTIRRYLSPTCLYSSAFEVQTISNNNSPSFHLRGKGWGHGVGLCQIGAAVMATEGHTADAILRHYYPGTQITTLTKH